MALPRLHPVLLTLRDAMSQLFPDELTPRDGESAWQIDNQNQYCHRCGATMGFGGTTARGCARCIDDRIAWDRLTRLGAYEPPMDLWIRRMKFHQQWRRAAWLGERLAEVVPQPFDESRVVVCPVPLHWRRRWQRGFNQSHLIAQSVAKVRGWPLAPVLRRTHNARPQSSLTASRRVANVRGVFAIHRVDLTDHEVILVDDVKTTGATLTQCTQLLRKAGARTVQVAVAAVADPQHAQFKAL